jgi:TP901 family phage tail tape measure protein
LDDVFLELSSKWDGLDKNTQRYIATIAAGSRQQSRFIAMMSDYGRTQELVASANNSAGASQKQFEKTTESLEYKVEKLKNAWHEFTMGIMNSDLVKFGVDVLTKFLDIINKATSGIKGLGGSLTKIISVVAVFKLASKVFGKIKQPLISFFADVVKMSREEGEKAGKAFDEGTRSGA